MKRIFCLKIAALALVLPYAVSGTTHASDVFNVANGNWTNAASWNLGHVPSGDDVEINNGDTATYTGGSGSNALTFSYTVASGQNTPDLTVTGLSDNGGTIKDGAGNSAVLSGAVTNPAGTLKIDTTAPTVTTSTDGLRSGCTSTL